MRWIVKCSGERTPAVKRGIGCVEFLPDLIGEKLTLTISVSSRGVLEAGPGSHAINKPKSKNGTLQEGGLVLISQTATAVPARTTNSQASLPSSSQLFEDGESSDLIRRVSIG